MTKIKFSVMAVLLIFFAVATLAEESDHTCWLIGNYSTRIHVNFPDDVLFLPGGCEYPVDPLPQFYWTPIEDIIDPGLALELGAKVLRIAGLSTERRGGDVFQTGINSKTFPTNYGYEIAVLLRVYTLSGAFKVEIHSSNFYAHVTLTVRTGEANLFWCCGPCRIANGPCVHAGGTTLSSKRMMIEHDMNPPAHYAAPEKCIPNSYSTLNLRVVYNADTQTATGFVDEQEIGVAHLPQSFGPSHIRLFVQSNPDELGPVNCEVQDVWVGIGRL